MIEFMFAVFGILLFAAGARLQWQIGRLILTEDRIEADWLVQAAIGNFMMPVGIALVATGLLA